jgi:hypothetical protein
MGAFSCSVLYYTAGRRPGQLLRLAPATATPPRRVAHGGDDGWGWWRVRANDGRRRAGGKPRGTVVVVGVDEWCVWLAGWWGRRGTGEGRCRVACLVGWGWWSQRGRAGVRPVYFILIGGRGRHRQAYTARLRLQVRPAAGGDGDAGPADRAAHRVERERKKSSEERPS